MRIRRKEQKGFTLVELITVIAVVSLLAIYLSVEIGDAGEDAKVSMASAFLLSNVPQAISSFRSRHAGYCSFSETVATTAISTTAGTVGEVVGGATQQLIDRGLFPKTPWGDQWTASYNSSARQITIAFPTTYAEEPLKAAVDIGLSADGKPQVKSAYGGTGTSPTTTIAATDTVATTAFGTTYFVGCTPDGDTACITYECN